MLLYFTARAASVRDRTDCDPRGFATTRRYLALHNVHQPVESPADFVDLYPASDYNTSNYARRVYNGMHSGVEFVVKNVTEELQSIGLWANCVFVLTGDNGYLLLSHR